MESLWSDSEAAKYQGPLELRVYTSRLLGQNKSLVLHGGGNTSVKIKEKNVTGEEETILYVKGSGWDLETIEKAGFTPVRLTPLLKLATLPSLSDPQMVNELMCSRTQTNAPAPSVEAILHATLPYTFVDHTHADAIVTITNTPSGRERIREVYGDQVVVIPYVMPGFDLARLCSEIFTQSHGPKTIGMVLMNHGIFSFGETARESYERMITLVDMAEWYLKNHNAWDIPTHSTPTFSSVTRNKIATCRQAVASAAGFPVILKQYQDDLTKTFVSRADLATISQQGPATPDHVIRTKQLPMLGTGTVGEYVNHYKKYFSTYSPQAKESKIMLDPAPRVILDPQLGLLAVGRRANDAHITGEIYQHTMEVILRATTLEKFQALPGQDIFDMEYWDLEQAKLRKAGNPPIFAGEVALVTGAASGIGKACVEALLKRGAAVVGLDIAPAITTLYQRHDFLGLICDITHQASLEQALDATISHFGGLDILILNAGIFPKSAQVAEMPYDLWRKVMELNLDANLMLLKLTHPLLKLAPRQGRVAIIGSKNVPAPGPGAAAYSTSKAALNQLARVTALEWAKDGIRINSLHPNAVFDTGIWSDEVLKSRAQHYGLSVEEYKKNNLLRTEVTSKDVAELAAELCGPLFSKTTAAQIPIDGGNERVI